MSTIQGEMRNNSIYLDLTQDPSLGSALSGANVGDTCKLIVEMEIISKDEKGIAGSISPGDVTPEGWEREEPSGSDVTTAPAPQPPGSQATAPVTVAMALRKKGGK